MRYKFKQKTVTVFADCQRPAVARMIIIVMWIYCLLLMIA